MQYCFGVSNNNNLMFNILLVDKNDQYVNEDKLILGLFSETIYPFFD